MSDTKQNMDWLDELRPKLREALTKTWLLRSEIHCANATGSKQEDVKFPYQQFKVGPSDKVLDEVLALFAAHIAADYVPKGEVVAYRDVAGQAVSVYTATELQERIAAEREKAEEQTLSNIHSIANDLANQDPKAVGAVSIAPYLANAVTIYGEYLKGDDFERIDWKALELPTLVALTTQKQGEK